MKFRLIGNKLVNLENILYINSREDEETGEIHCLYVLSPEVVIEQRYINAEAYQRALVELEIIKEQRHRGRLLNAISFILACVRDKVKHSFEKLCIIRSILERIEDIKG